MIPFHSFLLGYDHYPHALISTTGWFRPCVGEWCRHQMETFAALLALCEGNPPVTGGFPSQRPVTRSFDVFFNLSLNKLLNKKSRRWWFETPSRSSWRHCNVEHGRVITSHCFMWIQHFTGMCGIFIDHRCITLTKEQYCGLWCFFDVGKLKLLSMFHDGRFGTAWRSCDVTEMESMFYDNPCQSLLAK